MLEKKVPFCIDHFSIAHYPPRPPDRPGDQAGFTTADCYTDRTVHFIFENSYFELMHLPAEHHHHLADPVRPRHQSAQGPLLSPERQGD